MVIKTTLSINVIIAKYRTKSESKLSLLQWNKHFKWAENLIHKILITLTIR